MEPLNKIPEAKKQQQIQEQKPIISEGVKKFFIGLTTICTLIITASQSYLAYKQYQAAKLAYSPIFIFRKDLTKDIDSDKYDNENLKIINMGFPVNNYKSRSQNYLKITKTSGSNIPEMKIIPIVYYGGQVSYSGGKDEMGTFIGNDNNTAFVNLFWAINHINLNRGINDPSYELELVQAITLNYSDIEGEEHTKNFLDFKPSTDEALKQLEKDSKGYNLSHEIKNITTDQLIGLFNTQKS